MRLSIVSVIHEILLPFRLLVSISICHRSPRLDGSLHYVVHGSHEQDARHCKANSDATTKAENNHVRVVKAMSCVCADVDSGVPHEFRDLLLHFNSTSFTSSSLSLLIVCYACVVQATAYTRKVLQGSWVWLIKVVERALLLVSSDTTSSMLTRFLKVMWHSCETVQRERRRRDSRTLIVWWKWNLTLLLDKLLEVKLNFTTRRLVVRMTSSHSSS